MEEKMRHSPELAFERDVFRTTTAARIGALLEQRNITSAELANLTNNSQLFIDSILNGQCRVNEDVLIEIALALGMRWNPTLEEIND